MSIRAAALKAFDDALVEKNKRIRKNQNLMTAILGEYATINVDQNGRGGPEFVDCDYIIAHYDGMYFLLVWQKQHVVKADNVVSVNETNPKYVKDAGIAVAIEYNMREYWCTFENLAELGALITLKRVTGTCPHTFNIRMASAILKGDDSE